MKKFFLSQMILFLGVFSVFAQVKEILDERITKAVARNLPEWKAENLPNAFRPARGTYSSVLEARWKKENHSAEITIEARESSNINKKFDWLHPFLMRGIIPPNRKVENLGDVAHLVETASRVEIAFYKANIYAVLTVRFQNPEENKKVPDYNRTAPKEEVEAALEFARVVADAINGKRTVSPCFNNFYRRTSQTKAETLEEKLFAAILNDEAGTVKFLLAQNANPNHIFADGNTALHVAAAQGCLETVKLLIEAKADVNRKNKEAKRLCTSPPTSAIWNL